MKIIYTIVPPHELEPQWMVMKRWERDTGSDLSSCDLKIPRFYKFNSKEEANNFILIEKLSL